MGVPLPPELGRIARLLELRLAISACSDAGELEYDATELGELWRDAGRGGAGEGRRGHAGEKRRRGGAPGGGRGGPARGEGPADGGDRRGCTRSGR
ncbi:hypothetical protein PR202_ga21966 [Eleusine coracana subsp. coracana]|uniref:Uncharacterized protein n=1 Tax=Eleusine coracana subsp. coracana TaxID=191504 RepID=A0AAV5D1C4_ELECO|nr:hypothetical protein PR202_ga21966 [Eleusine coracana subsp. coracana]